jgi:putative ubiquitin-RnfH superfamily antitoxin RatB of RatAB toxin-antitoxin module
LERFPEIDLAVYKVGVFAKLAKLDQILRDGDRVEIYRSLPRKPRDAHAVDDKKARIRAKKEKRTEVVK